MSHPARVLQHHSHLLKHLACVIFHSWNTSQECTVCPACTGQIWPPQAVMATQGEFEVTTAAGTKFEDVDLSEGEWAEYDEKASEAVEILKIEHKFVLQR